MSQFIEYQSQIYKYLCQVLNNSSVNNVNLENLVKDLEQAIQQFSTRILKIGQGLHENISQGSSEADSMVCYYQQFSNYLLRISQYQSSTASQINSEVREPLEQFVKNYHNTNNKIITQSSCALKEIEQSESQVLRAQQEYYKLMSNAEKGSIEVARIVEGCDKGIKNKDDLMRASEKSVKLKEVAQDAQQDYKKIIEINNKKKAQYEIKWNEIIEQANLNNDSRNAFSKYTICSIIRIIGQNRDRDELSYKTYQDKLQEIDTRTHNEPTDIGKFLDRIVRKNGIIQPLIEPDLFISYDNHKKQQGQDKFNIQKEDQEDPQLSWMLVGDSLTDQDRNTIQQYLETLIQQGRILDQNQDITDEEQITKRQRIGSNHSSNSDSSYKTNTQVHVEMKQILQKASARQHFFNQLNNNSQLTQINDSAFNDLGNLLKNTLQFIDLNEIIDTEEIYSMLKLSSKIHKPNYHYLSQKLAQSNFWQKTRIWYFIFDYMSSKKMDEQSQLLQLHKGILKRGFGAIGKVFKGITHTQNQPPLETQAVYLILQELNLFLVNMQISQQMASDIIITLSFKHKLDKEILIALLEKQQEKSAKNYRQQYFSGQKIKDNLDNKYQRNNLHARTNRALFSIKRAIPYLSYQDKTHELLTISREFKLKLSNTINKFYLCNPLFKDSEKTEKQRAHYYRIILKLYNDDLDYIGMKIKVGLDMNIESSSIEEIIAMDVQRSLHIHSAKISSSILQSMLRIYAYFNAEVGYCQGMNYLVGYCFLFLNDEELAYKAFDKIMNRNFKHILIKDFEQMKIMFFQFQRLLNIFLPDLGEHFRQQKVESSYFLPQWIITMYSCALQYTARSSLLNIVWDILLIESWKGFFKATLFILKLFQDHLLQMGFEDILHFISEFIRNEIFMFQSESELLIYLKDIYGMQSQSIKQAILQIKVTNRLLSQIEAEHKSLIDILSQRIKEYQV